MVMTRTRAVDCGQKLRLFVPGEYLCVRRFRYRRLLTFLWLQGYGSAFVAMLKQTNSYFCVFHLVRLVSQGKWTQALGYIFPRFLPLEPCWTPSLEARVLVKFLRVHQLFQSQVRSKFSRDWRAMWAKAAKIVLDLANKTPELKDRLLLPDGLMSPQNVLPIGFSFAPFRRRRPTSKHARQKDHRRMAYIYAKKRMSVPSSSHCRQELSAEIIDKERDGWFGNFFEECIKAATCLELNQGCALQSSAREGASVTGNSQPQIGDCPRTQTQFRVPNWRPSKMMTRTRAVVCGEELQLFDSGEYPCVRRFRYRRLLAFLRLQGYGSTFVAMLKQTNYYFCVFHLGRLVSQGMWAEALDYIFPRFLPLEPCSPPSLEASVLVKFLRAHHLFHLEVASKISRDWKPMWDTAAKIVRCLANRTPEFKDRLLLPDRLMGPQNVLPIRFGFAPLRRRRHVKDHTRRTSEHAREEDNRRMACIYVKKRMSLPSFSHCSQELSPEIVAKARDDWFGRIFEQCIQAATCRDINEGRALQSSVWEGTSVTGNVMNSGCSSVPLTNDADIFGNVIDPKKSSISSVTTTGAPVAPVCYAMFDDVINSTENSVISSVAKTGSAISQTMLGTMACPAKDSEVISTRNTGTGQEICFTVSARQVSNPRKRPMKEQMEGYLATKKQLTSEANGETSTDQEVCFTESAHQRSHPRKSPMTEKTEDYSATKRQMTTGDNGQR